MNTIWIVMPILIVLMFLLGIDLNKKAFTNVARNPKAILLGMVGQIVVLPVVGFAVSWVLQLPVRELLHRALSTLQFPHILLQKK